MIGSPKLEHRPEQPYMGIRTQVLPTQFPEVIPQLLDEVFAWLGQCGTAPAGAPFMRYHVINMEAKMDVELGVPVASTLAGNERIKSGMIPSGRYASLIYTGPGIPANAALIQWAQDNHLRWDRWDDPNGDGFRSRVEYFLTDPDDEPDQSKWETEVAIKIAEN